MSEHEHDWQRMAKVAMGLQGDDPVNWPHYAHEAKKLVEDNESLRWQLAGADHRDAGRSGARRALPGEGTGMSGVVELAEQLAVAVKALEEIRVIAAREWAADETSHEWYGDIAGIAETVLATLRGAA